MDRCTCEIVSTINPPWAKDPVRDHIHTILKTKCLKSIMQYHGQSKTIFIRDELKCTMKCGKKATLIATSEIDVSDEGFGITKYISYSRV